MKSLSEIVIMIEDATFEPSAAKNYVSFDKKMLAEIVDEATFSAAAGKVLRDVVANHKIALSLNDDEADVAEKNGEADEPAAETEQQQDDETQQPKTESSPGSGIA